MHAIRLSMTQEKRAARKFESIATKNGEAVKLESTEESAYLVTLNKSLLFSYHGEE